MKSVQLGITGGIGSGKSVVCRILETMGIPVFDADTEAKKILLKRKLPSKSKSCSVKKPICPMAIQTGNTWQNVYSQSLPCGMLSMKLFIP
ncbi:MAG: dephospho-CoA kinase [Bacteroidetes bacterium]|nr:dephospho-CoA kinase [Bacteroidota bacterium]